MKGKKPLILIVLVLALLAAALMAPAVAFAKSDNNPAAWASWAQSGRYTTLFPVPIDDDGTLVWVPVPWKSAFAVHVKQIGGAAAGHEVMNWQWAVDTSEDGVGTPPWTHNRTTHLVACHFDADNQVTFIFRYDTSELGWPDKYQAKGDVYHVWVLTDNRGGGMDHVDLYTGMSFTAPRISDPSTWGFQILNLDCRGVQVVN